MSRFTAMAMLVWICGFAQRAATQATPEIAYTIRVDSAAADRIDVTLALRNVPPRVRLAMKVHPEYNAGYWRYLEFTGVTGSADDATAAIARRDTTLWEATLPAGRGDIHYRLHVPTAPSGGGLRRAWQTAARVNGALLNPPDVLLYLPDFTHAPTTIALDVPRSWRVATALDSIGSSRRLAATDAATMLDAPILLGALRSWSFSDRGTKFTAVYWPLPNATSFDTLALVDELRRLTHAALDVFGGAPTSRFAFLLEDGAGDALEHRASVTIGVPSANLAVDPHTHLQEIAHEFFHTWNLVAIYPDQYMALMYRHPPPTTGLWWGEGVTLHYADVLARRAGLVDTSNSRAHHVTELLSYYARAPWATSVSPEAASLAADSSLLSTPNATGSYYLQGELLANVLDALIRDSTGERRSLDDVYRALYARSANGAGITSREWERIADSACGCTLHGFFEHDVRHAGRITLDAAMARLGWRVVVDTVAAVDDAGARMPDLRVRVLPDQEFLRVYLPDPASVWARSGLRNGDIVTAIDGAPVDSEMMNFYQPLRRHHIGYRVALDVLRDRESQRIVVTLPGYDRSRVRLVDMNPVSPAQRARRARWMAGW